MISPEIKEKIQNYIQAHPEMRIYPQEAIISIMADEGIITKADLENIKAGGSIFGNNILTNNTGDFKEIFGGKFNIDNTPKAKINKLLKLTGLTMDKEGNIDTSHLTEEEIIKKFGKENCTIKRIKGAPKIFIEVKTGEGILLIGIPNGNTNATTSIQLMNTGLIIDSETNKFLSYNELDGTLTTNYDINGQIESTKNIKTGIYTKYENGYPFEQTLADSTTKNLLVEDLIKDITAKNFIGLPTTRDSIKDNVLKRITRDNAAEVLSEYKKQTGNDLIDDIKNEWGMNSKLKDELITHIQNCCPELLAQDLVKDIYGLGSGNLDKDIKKINKDNVKRVIQAYTFHAIKKDFDFLKLPTEEDLYLLPEEITDSLLDGTGSGLIADIMDEWGLPESKRKEYVNHILNAVKEAMEEDKNLYCEDIKTDIAKNKDDYKKLDIDLIRFSNRNSVEPMDSDLDETQKDESDRNIPYTIPDGEINEAYHQGHTGDCWLISGISAIVAKPEGKKALSKLIKTDPKTGDVIVTLKGIDKSLRVKASAIQNSNHLASGDGDIRAIEIAVDWVLKQLAYQGDAELSEKGKIVDINGNSSSTLFLLLFGEGYFEYNSDKIKQMNFNAPNSFYTTGFAVDESPKSFQTRSNTDQEPERTLITDHAYTILKEDDKYIYLYNPNIVFDPNNIDEKHIIKRTKEEFYELRPYIMGVNT